MAIESKNLVVAAKVYSRSIAAPLDASSVYTTLDEAQTYAKNPIAYAGQIITVLEGDSYVPYVLNGTEGSYTLSKISADASSLKNYVQIVTSLPEESQEQGVIYINTTDNKGYIYNGESFVVIFENVTGEDGKSLSEQLSEINTSLENKADLSGATFTGKVTLAADPENDLDAVTKQYVDRLISNIQQFSVGVVDSSNPLPSSGYKAGQAFRVAEAGTYAGQDCELGDLIICINDYSDGSSSDADFMVVQSNLDGAVVGPEASTDTNIAVFDGITGKKIADSNVSLASLQDAIAKAHEHTNKTVLDSFTSTQSEIEAAYKAYTDSAVDGAVSDEELSTTLENYYTKAYVDEQLSTLTSSVNSKLSTADFNDKIGEIGETTVKQYADNIKTEINEKLGDFGGSSVKDYVDTAIGAGGTDVSESIANTLTQANQYTDEAKAEAITSAKEYTDNALTIIEF